MKFIESAHLKDKNKFYRARLNEQNKLRLKNKDFTIISNDCNGSVILHDLSMQFKSPFVNLYIKPSHFIKYLTNIEYYRKCKLDFIKDKRGEFPIAYLDDVEICFLYYTSEQEAEKKWLSRTQRMNMENFFVIMSERDGCTYEDLKKFDELPIENKLVFTHKPYPEFKSAVYIPSFEKDGQVGVLLDFSGCCGYRYFDYFDYISWFNGESLVSLKSKNQNLGNKTVIGIRTHRWTETEEILHHQLQQYFNPKDIFVVIDEMKNVIEVPDYIQKVTLNKSYLNQNNILDNHPNPNGLGWLCGDYFYYSLADYVDADYYWLIEPDVTFTFDDVSEFFAKFQTVIHDALLHNFSKAPASWAWTERAKVISHDVYQAFFPLSRLSFRALDACKKERQIVSMHFKNNGITLSQFPNDESLVATAVIKHGLRVEKLNSFWPNSFKYFTYRNTILGHHAKNLLPLNQVVHPFRHPKYLGDILANHIQPIEFSENISNMVSNFIIDPRDIDTVITQMEKKVLSEIRLQLERYSTSQKYFLSIQKKFDEIATSPFKNISYKSWIWKNNTLVLDAAVHSNNQKYTLEYIFENNHLSCNIFSRSGDDEIFKIFEKNHPHFKRIGNKISLLHNDDFLQIKDETIENAIIIFKDFIKQINDITLGA